MSQMLKSSGAIGLATLTSRVLGLVREIVYARFMGTTWVADAFNLAFAVPNLFRRLLGEGALTAAFIPIFKQKEMVEGEVEMWRAANAVISGLLAGASLIVVAGVAGISLVLKLGLMGGQVVRLATVLAMMFPWVLTASLVALISLRVRSGAGSATARVLEGGRWAAALLAALLGGLLLGVLLLLNGGAEGGKLLLMLDLLRVMFPYVLLVCLAAVFMGMLNARGHFFVPAMGAAMLNVAMIGSVLWLAPKLGWKLEQQIFGLAIGVLIAGVAQAAFQLPLLYQEGFRYRWVRPWGDETVKKVVVKMVPGSIGVAAFQINVLLTQGLAFWVESGVLASFNVAVRLMELPQGVFGLSLATYLLPTLSGLAAQKKYPEFRAVLRQALDWLVFVNLLASALLLGLAEPMVRLIFERGLFDEFSTAASALALQCLAPGLVAFSAVNILARAFYALGDTTTPMKISVFCLITNLLLSAAVVWRLKQAGLGMANTLTAVLNLSLLLYALHKKMKTLELAGLLRSLGVLAGAAVAAGVLAWGLARLWENRWGHGHFLLRLGEVFLPMIVASLVYLAIAAAFRTGHLGQLSRVIQGRLRRPG